MKHTVTVTQTYLATRTATILVDADSAEAAQEAVASGAIDLPDFDSGDWRTGWDLQSETVTVTK